MMESYLGRRSRSPVESLRDSLTFDNGREMTGRVAGRLLGFSAAMLLAHGAATAGDRMVVRHSKQPTDAESGLGYEYTFKVTRRGSDHPVDGAEYSMKSPGNLTDFVRGHRLGAVKRNAHRLKALDPSRHGSG